MYRLLVCGSARCGTTITNRLIGSCPDICLTNELRTYMSVASEKYLEIIAERINIRERGVPSHVDKKNFKKNFKEYLKENGNSMKNKIEAVEKILFEDRYNIIGDKGLWAEHSIKLDLLGLPHKIVFTYRDGRDAVASGMRRPNNKNFGWATKNPTRNSEWWAANIGLMLKAIESGFIKDYLVLRFEDFIYNPEKNIQMISDFVGINKKDLENNYDRLFNLKNIHIGSYKKDCPDWKETFTKDALELLKKLKYI